MSNAYRVWCAEVYPESIKEDWIKILDHELIPCSISPVHNRDVFEEDVYDKEGNLKHAAGELKKPHYHLVMQFSGKRTFESVWDMLKLVAKDGKSTPRPEPARDVKSAVRYHTHIDHPEKAQYSEFDVTYLNGVEHSKYFKMNEQQEDDLVRKLMRYIRDNDINDYWILLESLMDAPDDDFNAYDLFTYARKHTILFNSMISSRRNYNIAKNFKDKVDKIKEEEKKDE